MKEISRDTPVLLLALGNDILSDDAVGFVLANRVGQVLQNKQNIVIKQTNEMGLALLDLIDGYEKLIVIDSIVTGKEKPGFVHQIQLSDLKFYPQLAPHSFGIGEAITLGRQLGMAVPKEIIVIAVEVKDPFTVGTELTDEVKLALDEATQKILFWCKKFCPKS